jgi:hypothetical protein
VTHSAFQVEKLSLATVWRLVNKDRQATCAGTSRDKHWQLGQGGVKEMEKGRKTQSLLEEGDEDAWERRPPLQLSGWWYQSCRWGMGLEGR